MHVWTRAACAAVIFSSLAGCSVQIKGTTAETKPPGASFAASAETDRNGTSPTGVTLRYTRTRATATGLDTTPEQTTTVSSNVDIHTATVSAAQGQTFAPFDRVNLKWRVGFNTWGSGSSNSAEETVLIDPSVQVTISPQELTAGSNGTLVVSIAQPRPVDTVVSLEVTDQPNTATVTLDPAVVTIPANSTAAPGVAIKSVATPPPSGSSVGIGGSGVDPRRCTVRARIQVPSIGTFEKSASFRVVRP